MKEEIKAFTMRMPEDLWYFLRKWSLVKKVSMMTMINEEMRDFQKRNKKALTHHDTRV